MGFVKVITPPIKNTRLLAHSGRGVWLLAGWHITFFYGVQLVLPRFYLSITAASSDTAVR